MRSTISRASNRGWSLSSDAAPPPPKRRRPMPKAHLIQGRALRIRAAAALALLATTALQATTTPSFAATGQDAPMTAEAAVGRALFFDASLSQSGHQSCASCHSPAHAYGPPNGLAVQLGGPEQSRQGVRAVPSLRYVLNRAPAWSKEFIANPAERLLEGEEPPTGGLGWDGRFNTLHDQAQFPLLADNELANRSAEQIATGLRRSAYAGAFRKVFGEQIFDDPQRVYAKALEAIEQFELQDPSFHPYTSKYDDYLDGNARLTRQELRGLALFDDPKRGNCASCHLDRKGVDGSHPLFTDYQFEALGVPRNPEILANRAPDYFDLGLCGPLRKDQADQALYCGMFRTPTLRNVATRRVFFHNGRFHTLKDALQFYVQRDTDPRRWYPVAPSGAVEKFDDLPAKLRTNVDAIDEPLTRHEGGTPAWSNVDIDDVIAFLQTLTDRDVQSVAN
jgi:cytochrome c peroxidase